MNVKNFKKNHFCIIILLKLILYIYKNCTNIIIMKTLNISNLIKYISYYFDKELFKCSICFKKTTIFYLICKPNCTNNSYCKECIERIEKETNKCPFTNTFFTKEDISIDYRKNKSLEIFEEIHENLCNKNITININFNN